MSPQNHEQVVAQAVANRYQNAEKTKVDVMTALHNYRGLSPKLDKFVFNDGTDRELLNLDGTIPVRYKGAVYNIPICIWLLDNHPFSSPMVYVKPTPDMLIKASRHVDQNGKVYLPYLHEWNLNSSDLPGLIQIMIITFSEMPPVYSKPKSAQPATGSPYPTPYPTNPPGYMPMPGGGPSLPYPPAQPTASGAYPPYPSQPGYPPTSTPYPVYPPTSSTGYPPSQPGGPPATYPPPYTPGIQYPSYPSTTSSNLPTQPTTTETNTTTASTGTITEEHIRASLISAVSDRVRAKLRDSYGGAQAEVSVLRQQQADLNEGKTKVEGLISKLEQEQAELDKNVRVLREREAEIKSVLSRLSSATEPLDVDEAVTTTAPLYKQLLNAYAEDQATQDAIYYLGEALRRDVIDLDLFLKHVRSLSRKQFQLRATMIKCRAKGNMAG
ncbi:tumor susceptibility gene 101 protein isoform X2 [Procambarus clarkii]|uniref:Tumor susceptibility protein 101-like protein n=1 Tax=Procambarus clarkii TaxID=6728 RepID=A0A0U1WXY4_PROCL|nr:tumor susceptibility gene 101 protein-like isoform X2 [Procambarus clarkii]AGZ84436.1 tumor susceptibility protein 101-like protein [Procambarus clarkii]